MFKVMTSSDGERQLAGADDPTVLDWAAREDRVLITDDIEKVEREVQAEYAAEKKYFLGPKTILRQSPDDRPKTREPRRKLWAWK